jgi:parallel beta-helix repeat protein
MTRMPDRLPSYLLTADMLNYLANSDYIIYKSGTTILSLKVSTGTIVSQGTNATTVINATIAACSGGECIYFRPGAYTIVTSIVGASKNNIELWLSRNTIFTLQASADTHMFYLDTVSGWWIHGGELNGNEANMTTPGGAANTNSYGIYLYRTTNMKISDMYIHEWCRAGIKTEGNAGVYAIDTMIVNCNISDCNWAGVLPDTYSKGVIIRGCLFTGDGEGGVAGGTVSPIYDILVDGCTQHDMNGAKAPVGYEAGIYIEAGTQIKVVNNHCFNCKVGIFVTADGDIENIIANNTVHDCTGNAECTGILVKSPKTVITGNNVDVTATFKPAILAGSGSDHFGSECVVSNNYIYGTTNCHGIQIVRSDNVIVAHNIINVAGKGIMLMTNTSNSNVLGNRILVSSVGIEIDAAACTRNWIDSNNMDGCTDAMTDAGTNTRYGSNIDQTGAIVIAGMP